MAKKRVRLSCHGPIAVGAQYESLWEDVYLRYRTRPGRSHSFGPCLIGKVALEQDLGFQRARASQLAWRKEHLAELELINTLLETTPMFINRMDGLYKKGIPNIYTAAPFITRAVAEELVEQFLKERGVTNVKFSWKRPDFIITPT